MSSVERSEVGVFKREDAIVFDDLNDMTQEEILSHLIPVEKMFMHCREARMDAFFNRLYSHGETIKLSKLRGISGEVGEILRVYDENGFYSLGEIIESDGIKYFRQKKFFR
jgi:tRNA U55 pseudouridine synthase TruB